MVLDLHRRRHASFGWLVVTSVALTVTALLGWRAWRVQLLRMEVEGGRYAAWAAERTRRESEALKETKAAWSSDRSAELALLRASLAELQRVVAAQASSDGAAPSQPERLAATHRVSSSAEWRNVGNDSAPAALETTLWAAAGGDTERVASLLMFANDSARTAADTLLQGLPEEQRARYGSAEHLIAELLMTDVPIGTAEIQAWSLNSRDRPTRFVNASFTGNDGQTRNATLMFVRQDAAWKLGVTPSLVARCASLLRGDNAVAVRK